MSVSTFVFTKPRLAALPLPRSGKRTYYKDAQVKGLVVAVGASGSQSFYVYKKIFGRPVRVLLGTLDTLHSIENVRKQARIIIGQVAEGKHPHEEKQRLRHEMTLGEMYEQYMTRYSKPHKRSWQRDVYEITHFFGHWFSRRLSSVQRTEVQRLQDDVFAKGGRYRANAAIKQLRAVYNKAIEWGWEGKNPTLGIKLYKEESRDRFVQPAEMPHLIQALNDEANQTAKDYLWLLLLTGVRKMNALTMRWEQINWERQEWRIPDTKNGEPLTLPLIEQVMSILRRRYAETNSPWVFPQADAPEKRMINPRSPWRRVLERATIAYWRQQPRLTEWVKYAEELAPPSCLSSISVYKSIVRRAAKENVELPTGLMDLRLHDIRRTFGSYQALIGSSLQIIGKSLGHKSMDSTQIYARLNLDPVRASIERATAVMLQPFS